MRENTNNQNRTNEQKKKKKKKKKNICKYKCIQEQEELLVDSVFRLFGLYG